MAVQVLWGVTGQAHQVVVLVALELQIRLLGLLGCLRHLAVAVVVALEIAVRVLAVLGVAVLVVTVISFPLQTEQRLLAVAVAEVVQLAAKQSKAPQATAAAES